jgi:hypothetical protein
MTTAWPRPFFPAMRTDAVTEIGLPLALIPSEALGIAERRLAEARVARDSLNFSAAALGAVAWGRARS